MKFDSTSVSVVLLDIEGTTTSIAFVKDVLFGFVRKHLEGYLKENWFDAKLQDVISSLISQNDADLKEGLTNEPIHKEGSDEDFQASVVLNVLWQMDHDRKTGALKQLQGLVYEDGFKQGLLKGHVYDDVPKAFEAWTESNKQIYIYSSGSVQAQKLLFGYTEHGDLSRFVSGYFDTNVGPKTSCDSYKRICDKVGIQPSTILFLTDVPAEARAAHEAGLLTLLAVRPGNAMVAPEDLDNFGSIKSFQELFQS